MQTPLLELEGTWEDIAARAPDFAGRRLRLIVLPELMPAADSLLHLLGSVEATVSDVAARHDEYLGQELAENKKADS